MEAAALTGFKARKTPYAAGEAQKKKKKKKKRQEFRNKRMGRLFIQLTLVSTHYVPGLASYQPCEKNTPVP